MPIKAPRASSQPPPESTTCRSTWTAACPIDEAASTSPARPPAHSSADTAAAGGLGLMMRSTKSEVRSLARSASGPERTATLIPAFLHGSGPSDESLCLGVLCSDVEGLVAMCCFRRQISGSVLPHLLQSKGNINHSMEATHYTQAGEGRGREGEERRRWKRRSEPCKERGRWSRDFAL